MLSQLIGILNEGGIQAMDAVARRLGVSVALVAAMADSLAQRGYLVDLNQDCGSGCGGCSLASACHVAPPGQQPARLLMLSAKGRLAAGRR